MAEYTVSFIVIIHNPSFSTHIFHPLGEVSHTYSTAGVYMIQVTVSDGKSSNKSDVEAIVQDEIKGLVCYYISLTVSNDLD